MRAWLDGLAAEHAQFYGELAGTDVGHVRATAGDWVIESIEYMERRIESRRSAPLRGVHDGVTAPHLGVLYAGQVQSHTIAGADRGHGVTQTLNAPHTNFGVARTNGHAIVNVQRPAGQRARDHRAAAFGCEDAIDPQSRTPAVGSGRGSHD